MMIKGGMWMNVRVAGGRRPGFNLTIELFAGLGELFNGALAV